MVLGIAMIATSIPTIFGLNEASNAMRDREKNTKENARKTRFSLRAVCDASEGSMQERDQVDDALVYLGRDQKLYITKDPASSLSPFNGHLYRHPDFEGNNLSGLISMSAEDKPLARWVFLDSETNEMRWGGRKDTEGHVCGPFDLTDNDAYLTLDDTQRWMAVQLPGGSTTAQTVESSDDSRESAWRLYFDRKETEGDDLPAGSQRIRIFLRRTPEGS
ncbi:hypothetical protein BJY01DRAFT_246794 [Aspergillus pseudoustus]|uniref:Uncharacterized protein n=1 Tax=Aspergillus pseudoustus TaxID=1810923 RepID=A0ABR4K5X4_9EURO